MKKAFDKWTNQKTCKDSNKNYLRTSMCLINPWRPYSEQYNLQNSIVWDNLVDDKKILKEELIFPNVCLMTNHALCLHW